MCAYGWWMQERGVNPKDFNTYGARRGNDQVMARGTFANIRLINKLVKNPGPMTVHIPSGEVLYRLLDTHVALCGVAVCGVLSGWCAV